MIRPTPTVHVPARATCSGMGRLSYVQIPAVDARESGVFYARVFGWEVRGDRRTMPKEHLNPSSLFRSVPYGFSQVVIASGSRTVFISGQTAWDANNQIVGRSLGEQARQALRNVRTAIEAAGGDLSDIVALRIYIVHHAGQTLEGVGAALREAFTTNPPASTWIGVSSLAVAEFLIEIEATAVLE